MKFVDVLVLGGGPSGLVTAMELCRLGFSVVVAEATQLLTPKLGETLSAQAMLLLQRLGLEEEFRSQAHTPAHATRSSWGSSSLEDNLALFDPYGGGWHLDRSDFDLMLMNHAKLRGVDVRLGARALQIKWQDNHWETQISIAGERSSLNSVFLVDATGRGGYLSGRFSNRRKKVDQLIGVAKTFFDAKDQSEPWTLVEAVNEGWWYSSPLPISRPHGQQTQKGNMLAVYMTDADLFSNSDEPNTAWRNALEQSEHTQCRLNKLKAVSELRVHSAKSCFSNSESGENWLAVGDAALSLDPISGQGLKLALETGIAAAYAIAEHRVDQGNALHRYRKSLELTWSDYLQRRNETYRLETRWCQSTFWLRRH